MDMKEKERKILDVRMTMIHPKVGIVSNQAAGGERRKKHTFPVQQSPSGHYEY